MRSLTSVLFSLHLLTSSCNAFALDFSRSNRQRHERRAEPLALQKRMATTSSLLPASTTDLLTIVTPSPSANPVAVTEQGQIVTFYEPQAIICSFFTDGSTDLGISSTDSSALPSVSGTAGPNCTTIYNTCTSSICHATITGLATPIVVSDCSQQVTFSKEFGATLVSGSPTISGSITITSPPSIETTSTYFVAPWSDLTSGKSPSKVHVSGCSTRPDGSSTTSCMEWDEVWSITTVIQVIEVTTSMNFSSVMTGPAEIMFGTQLLNVSGTTTVQLSTAFITASNSTTFSVVRSTISTATTKTGIVRLTSSRSDKPRDTKTVTDEFTVTKHVQLVKIGYTSSATTGRVAATTGLILGVSNEEVVSPTFMPTREAVEGQTSSQKTLSALQSSSRGIADPQASLTISQIPVPGQHIWNATRPIS